MPPSSVSATKNSNTSERRPHPRRVLIIGGGPCGLVSLRNCVERGDFERVELVERRNDIGGVWNLDTTREKCLSSVDSGTSAPKWHSPAYPGMVGNVLPEFLSFSGLPFPAFNRSPDEAQAEEQPFPTLTETQAYLQTLAAPYLANRQIRLNVEVLRVEELPCGQGWKVWMRDWRNKTPVTFEETWDAVVVAIGWFDNLVFPQTLGIEELWKHDPKLAMHAKDWNDPKAFEGKRVLVIGNAASANDIAAQLASVTPYPKDDKDFATSPRVFRSVRRPAFPGFPSLPDVRIVDVAPVDKYTVVSKDSRDSHPVKVEAMLRDGTRLTNLDLVIFGTGYRPHAPIVHVLAPPFISTPTGKGDSSLASLSQASLVPLASTLHGGIPALHYHILYAHNPTLAYIGSTMSFTPFTIADVASTWLALAWSRRRDAEEGDGGAILYPDTAEGRLAFEQERMRKLNEFVQTIKQDSEAEAVKAGNPVKPTEPTSFLSYPVLSVEETPYARMLRKEIVTALPRRASLPAELDAILPHWNDEEFARRNAMYALKLESLKAMKAKMEREKQSPGH